MVSMETEDIHRQMLVLREIFTNKLEKLGWEIVSIEQVEDLYLLKIRLESKGSIPPPIIVSSSFESFKLA